MLNPKRARYTPEMLKAMIKSDEEIEVLSWLKRIYAGRNIAERISILRELAQKGLKDPEYIATFKEVIRRGKFLQELQAIEGQFRSDRLRHRNPVFPYVCKYCRAVAPDRVKTLVQADMWARLHVMVKHKRLIHILAKRRANWYEIFNNPTNLENPKMPINFLGPGDREFIINVLEPYFRVRAVRFGYSYSRKKWPDIEVDTKPYMKPDIDRASYGLVPTYIPIITVTAEWRRQSDDERRKRLVHEFLHIQGLQHGKIGNLDYNTMPELDTYSMSVYRKILRW